MNNICIVIPTYNERLNIKLLIEHILSLNIPNLAIAVIDDNSPDKTWEVVESLSKKYKQVHLLLRKTDKGRGSAGIDGFRYALDNSADIIIEMDADFSHQPQHIPALLEALKKTDVVVGSRFLENGTDKRKKLKRKILTVCCNFYANLILGLHLTDPNSGYRCYKRKVIETIINNLYAKGADIVQDVIYNCRKRGFKISEIPINFQDRKLGETTKTSKDFIAGAITCLKLRFS